jgi:hypothetical protein
MMIHELIIDSNLTLSSYDLLDIEINVAPAVEEELAAPLEEASYILKDLINEVSGLLTSEDYILIQEKVILLLNKIIKCIKKDGDVYDGITQENALRVKLNFHSLQEDEFKQIVKKWTDVINKDLGNITCILFRLHHRFIC